MTAADLDTLRAESAANLAQVEVWKQEHAKAHGDWMETRKTAAANLARAERAEAALALAVGHLEHSEFCSRGTGTMTCDCGALDALKKCNALLLTVPR